MGEITKADILARMPALRKHFGTPASADVPLIPCVNVDTSKLPTGPDIPPLPEPSTEHTIINCDVCGEQAWIGPTQKRVAGTRACYICVCILHQHSNASSQTIVVSLNPNADAVPRRASRGPRRAG